MTQRRSVAAFIVAMVALGSSAAGADGLQLQFRPQVGQKQTVRISTHVATTPAEPTGGDRTERVWVLTLELEPLAVSADGAVTLKATVREIQYKLLSSRLKDPVFALDSTDETRRYEQRMALCLAPIGESFTAVVSPQGRIKQVDTEAFRAAAARKRIEYENEAVRREATRRAEWVHRKEEDEAKRARLVQADVEKALRDEDRKYGSAAGRESTYRKDASESFLYSLMKLEWLLKDLLVPFPAEAAAADGRWTAPVMICADGPLELTGTYTLQSQDNGTCTIRVEARRTMQDQCYGAPPVPKAHRTRLAGTYQATLKIDRVTGTVLSKETATDLTGRTSTYMPGFEEQAKMLLVTTKATTKVELVP